MPPTEYYPEVDATGFIFSLTATECTTSDGTPVDCTISADAAGLAILPGLIRWEEIYEDGEINHASRVTLDQIQRSYIRPAARTAGAGTTRRALPWGCASA